MNDYQNWFTRPDSPSIGMNPQSVNRPDLPGEVGGKQRVARRHIIAELARKENMTPGEAQSLFEQLPSLGGDYVLPRGESEEVRPELQGAYEHAERHGFAKPGSGNQQHQMNPQLPSGGPELTEATLRMTHFFRQRMAPVVSEATIPAGRTHGVMVYDADGATVRTTARGDVSVTLAKPAQFPTKRSVL